MISLYGTAQHVGADRWPQTVHIRYVKATRTHSPTFLLQMSASGATYAAVPHELKGKEEWLSSSSTRDNPKSDTCAFCVQSVRMSADAGEVQALA